jgi:hypothetical protein
MRSIRKTVISHMLLSIYYGEFYTWVIFSILIWGSKQCSCNIQNSKESSQLMCDASVSAPCRLLFKKHGILLLPCIYMFAAIVCAKKNISNYDLNDSYHNYDTRNSKNLHQTYVRTKNSGYAPQHMGLLLYNKLPM